MKILILLVSMLAANATAFAISADDMPDANMRKTFQLIEALVGGKYNYIFRDDVPDVAISQPGRIILVNPDIWLSTDGYGRFFWLLHEIGHHKLGHTSQPGMVAGALQPWLRPQMELAADAFAIKMMLKSELKAERIREMATALFTDNPGDSTHPSGAVRLSKIEKILADE